MRLLHMDGEYYGHDGSQYLDTKLADRTAALNKPAPPPSEPVPPSPSLSTRSLRPGTPKGKGSPAPPDSGIPSSLVQIRAELASTQRTRAELETKLANQNTELEGLKVTDAEQKKRIAQLEKTKEFLERRVKDRSEELKGKGRFVNEVQDEMVSLELQLNMAEKEVEKLRNENEDLTRRWLEKMELEAKTMNDRFEKESKRKG